MKKLNVITILMAILLSSGLMAQESVVNEIFSANLTDIEGREGMMVTVSYPPGVGTPKHRHNAYTFVYVLEGAVLMQIEGGDLLTLEQGQTFYENPSDIHTVSMNASETKPAKILVFSVKKIGSPLLVMLDE